SASGTEVLYHPSYGNLAKCEQLGKIVANAFGTNWRGVKSRPDLGWLNKTKTDYYFELLFIDNESDMEKYNQNADRAAKALVEAVTGKTLQGVNSMNTDDGRRKIKTGGLGIGAIKEVSDVLVERNIKASIIFEGKNGNPYVLTEKMSNPEMDKFTAWLDERKWYYEYLQ
ncbi:N-acetylmuramoyl-L-alanine amidase C-terminal domain-containing protein, partial [Bacillus cytotoxicus]